MAQVVMPSNNQDPDITRRVSKKKRSVWDWIMDLFFSDNIDNAVDYVVNEVIIPNAKETLYSSISNAADILIRKRGSRGTIRSENRNPYYDSSMRVAVQADTTRAVPRHQGRVAGRRIQSKLTDYYFSSEADAQFVLDQMDAYAEKYGFVSIDDYCQLIGVSGSHVDRNWGWTTMGNAKVRREGDGWVIDFEEATPK